jgi:hypothetical protein
MSGCKRLNNTAVISNADEIREEHENIDMKNYRGREEIKGILFRC